MNKTKRYVEYLALTTFSLRERLLLTAMSTLIVAVVIVVHLLTKTTIELYLFFLLPIVVHTVTCGLHYGLIAALVLTVVKNYLDMLNRGLFDYSIVADFCLTFYLFVGTSYVIYILVEALRRESESARVDYLTGLFNRKFFYEQAEIEIARIKRYDGNFNIILIDCDNFKSINDTYGHNVGDKVLRLIGQTIKANVRHVDLPARIGGDEFVIMFPGISKIDVHKVANKLNINLLQAMKDHDYPVTFSAGVLSCSGEMFYSGEFSDLECVMKKVDTLMYSVKKGYFVSNLNV